MKTISKIMIVFTIILCVSSVGMSTQKEQSIIVTSQNSKTAFDLDETISLSVIYDVSTGQKNLSSLGIRIHYDSSVLKYTGALNQFKISELGEPQVTIESTDLDGDPSTDKYILLTWADVLFASWPGENVNLPLNLVDLIFKVISNKVTKVNVTQQTGDSAFGFNGTGLVINK